MVPGSLSYLLVTANEMFGKEEDDVSWSGKQSLSVTSSNYFS